MFLNKRFITFVLFFPVVQFKKIKCFDFYHTTIFFV